MTTIDHSAEQPTAGSPAPAVTGDDTQNDPPALPTILHRPSHICAGPNDEKIGYIEFGATVDHASSPSSDLKHSEGHRNPPTPVFYLHGLPGSRFEAGMWHKAALKMNVRLIALDRPGLGLSDRCITGKDSGNPELIRSYPAQVAAVAKHLDLDEASGYHVIGVSGGGPYALSCAAAAPYSTTSLTPFADSVDHTDDTSKVEEVLLPGLRSVAVVAGLGPRDIAPTGMSIFQRLAIRAMDLVPQVLVRWIWQMMFGSAARNSDRSVLETRLRRSLEAQKDAAKKAREAGKHDASAEEMGMYVDNEDIFQSMLESMRGAFAQGEEGYVDDASRVCRDWGFQFGEIGKRHVSVSFWYGGKDGLAPASVGRAMAEKLCGEKEKVRFTEYEGESHTATVLKHQEDILKTLLSA